MFQNRVKHGKAPSSLADYYHKNKLEMNCNCEDVDMLTENIIIANDTVFTLLLTNSENMHINIYSDFDIKKYESIFASMASKYNECHKAYFGLGKILFCKNELNKALEMFELAIKTHNSDPSYWLWAAFVCLYLYRQCPKHLPSKNKFASKVEKYSIECLKIDKKRILDIESSTSATKIKPKFAAEDLAVMIKQANDYKGYVSWSEIYICRGKTKFATDVIEELIDYYPDNPEAYFRLWSLYNKFPSSTLSIAEKMFTKCYNHKSLETKICMILIYSKSLFQNSYYLQCFELLQNEYSKYPQYSVLLYYYGKYVALSESNAFFGSGIGALQECKRVCISERLAKINYYTAIYYIKLERHGKACRYMQKAKKDLSEIEKDKKKLAEDYLENNKKFYKVIDTTKKMIKARENSASIYALQEGRNDKTKGNFSDVNKMIKSLTDIYQVDPITIGLLKAEVYTKIFKDKTKGTKELKNLMKELQKNY